ncbi:Fic family protein [Pedobacter changchengzhani]|uniref:Fic family protein n=1 Tax=Pedobacter changchengzhani TaxID=2529274 RepID=A0A4R5MLU5_9SPHI|nr:Fic family protein [Pedobacter changchengzhani]TDG36079.1 Fic family protein [Pedobacter changchengzhani]
MFIHQLKKWPQFSWREAQITTLLASVRFQQGKLLGAMAQLGFDLQSEAVLQTLTQEVIKSSEIEGEILNREQVRSSIARRLGMDIVGAVLSDRYVDGVVEMMVDATQKFTEGLDEERLFSWHASLFPTGRAGMYKIVVGDWRQNDVDDPMQVVSVAMGKETLHFQAPNSDILLQEMKTFLSWFDGGFSGDPIIKAAIAHLWFVTIHPFEDGNGRISRAIADMQLARADGSSKRFYSMSNQIRQERSAYYEILEKTQSGGLDITNWMVWFLECLERAIKSSDIVLASVLRKAKLWAMPVALSFNDRQKMMLNKLLDGFDGKLTSSKWAKIAKCSQDTASRDIQDLIVKGLLVKDEAGGRSTNYLLVN